jgi:glycosyltransferase involved in cell wall biosynthesis
MNAKAPRPILSTTVLNWNRAHLLKLTLESFLDTVSVPFELTIVDNASTDGSRDVIEEIQTIHPSHRFVGLRHNLGGKAINSGFRYARGEFLHVSENDIEYRPGWDVELLGKFDAFPDLGQISPFGPEPDRAAGEAWERLPSTAVTHDDQTIYLTEQNVTTTSIMRRQFWDAGFRWGSIPRAAGGGIKLPDDFSASGFVHDAGSNVAWNDRYVVVNWGHNVAEWKDHLDYYLRGYLAKPWVGLDGLRERLNERGYDLVMVAGKYQIVSLADQI